MGNAANHGMGMWYLGQVRTLNDFLNLEYIDAITLSSQQFEKQQFKTIMPRQLRPLIDAV